MSPSPVPAVYSAPGNLLLLGEYAVLEEGGLGIAVAVEPRATAHVDVAGDLVVHARFGGTTYVWTPGELPPPSELLGRLANIEGIVDTDGGPGDVRGAIDVDSSAFFLPSGRKLGLGSSAAVTLVLLSAFRTLKPGASSVTFADAVAAHRFVQGGRGSGYDVAASMNGGIGLFAGGVRPSWTPLRGRPALDTMRLRCVHAPSPVRTADAVARYELWKRVHRAAARAFLAESNRIVAAFAEAASADEAADALRAARVLGVRLGEDIGVPADVAHLFGPGGDRPPLEPGSGGASEPIWKASGAGDELAVGVSFAANDDSRDGDHVPVVIAQAGLEGNGGTATR